VPVPTPLLLEKVRETIAAHHMLAPGQRVLTAVSGGPDSVAMLHVLLELGYGVIVAHLDHMTRNGESAKDATFVEQLAEQLGVPFVSEQRAVEMEAETSGESFEQTARMARYAFFAKAAEQQACAAIATGHTANDVAETVLWRIIRGTSIDGLAGIPPTRSLGDTTVVRPLIDCTRDELLHYLASRSIDYRQDASNEDQRFLRNRIRHDLMPLLKSDYNPKMQEALVRLATLARDDAAILNEILDTLLDRCIDEDEGLNRKIFAAESDSLQRRALQRFAQRQGVEPTFERTEAARQFIVEGATGAKLNLGGGTLVNTKTHTRFERAGSPPDECTLKIPGNTEAFGHRFFAQRLERLPEVPFATYCSPSRQVFDADILGPEVRIRPRQPGDRFTPFGMDGTRKLQDYFVDTATPQDERDRIPIVEADGRIAWIVGGAIGAEFAVSDTTQSIVEIEVLDAPE
jgi:tRNA(Ile)-lysidine synthase